MSKIEDKFLFRITYTCENFKHQKISARLAESKTEAIQRFLREHDNLTNLQVTGIRQFSLVEVKP